MSKRFTSAELRWPDVLAYSLLGQLLCLDDNLLVTSSFMESLVLQINDTVLIFVYVIDLHRSCDLAPCSPSTEN